MRVLARVLVAAVGGAAAAASTVVLAGCGAAGSGQDYRSAAADAAKGAASQVQTGRLVAELAAADRATGPYLGVLVEDSRQAVQQEHDQLRQLPAPPGQERLAGQLDGLLGEASTALDELDAAVASGDRPRAGQLAGDLGTLGQRLRDLAEANR